MAIINNNVQNVKFLRNQTPFASREEARTALEGNKSQAADGTALLARYTVGGTVKTIVGFVYVTDSTHDITIFDTEGASGDVDKLREEINAKLGTTFITSGNTVEANLTALSGGTFVPGTSSSANTSVEGAKAYAYDLIGTLDNEDAAVAGQYVSQVTQADGKIAVTRVELPSSADTAVAKKFVTAVAENKGQIVVSRGEISSTAETMVLTDNADGGVNFEVNIDGVSIVQDATSKKLKVADTALVQYVGDEDTIQISAVDPTTNTKTISSPLTISATTPSEANVKEQYNLVGANGNTIGATIKIYKDSSLYNVYLGHMNDTIAGDPPVVTPGTGDAALCFIYHKEDGSYQLVPINVETFLEESEFASGVTATNHIVHGVVDPQSEKDSQDTLVDFLTVGADGFKVSGIKDEIDRKINALDATGGTQTIATDKHVAVEVIEANGLITAVNVTEGNIADADDLAELSGKTITAITSTNGSIAATISNEAGNKTADIQTDADKIKMSGFSADATSALSGISEGDSIATAFEKTNTVITDNERVTANALTDLDGRLDVVEAEYISGVSVNGNAVTVANKVAPISIIAATTAATGTTAIVVDTDNSGNITLGIANIDCGYYA